MVLFFSIMFDHDCILIMFVVFSVFPDISFCFDLSLDGFNSKTLKGVPMLPMQKTCAARRKTLTRCFRFLFVVCLQTDYQSRQAAVDPTFRVSFTTCDFTDGRIFWVSLSSKSSSLCYCLSFQPNSNGLQPNSDGLQPNSDGLQPNSDGLQPNSNGLLILSLLRFL